MEVVWSDKKEKAKEPYDMKIVENNEEIFIDVRSLKGEGKAWFNVSKDQWRFMEEKGDRFYIYKVYWIENEIKRLEKIPNPVKLWLEKRINAYPIRIEL